MQHKTLSLHIPQTHTIENSLFLEYVSTLQKQYTLNNKILLIQSPQFLLETCNPEIIKMKGYYVYPPTGLQWIAKSLSGRSLEIEILDLNYHVLKRIIEDENFDYHNWLEILDDCLKRLNPSVVGVTTINVNSNIFRPGYPFTSILKHLRDKDKSIVIAGGAMATDELDNFLNKDLCHFVVGGEGENKINFLFDCLYDKGPMTTPVQGIHFKSENNISQTSGVLDKVILKGNLINSYDLIPIEDYHKVGSLNPYSRMVGQDTPFAVFQLVRGCTGKCEFCGVPGFMGKGIRNFPVNELFEEIKYLVENKNIRHFDALDDTVLGKKEAAKDLLGKLVKLREKYGITWSCNNGLTATSITEELLCLMRDSGCVGFRIGIESGNAELLKRMKKPASLPLLRRVGKALNNYPEMFIGAYYIIGMFGNETFGEMMETFRFSFEMNLDWSSFATFQVTSKETTVNGDIKENAKAGGDFIPSKNNTNREISIDEKVLSGTELFDIPENTIPSFEQTKEIWFTFNLVANYIHNKNLKEGGRLEKFVSWIEAVKIPYPQNPYMSLFAGLAHSLNGCKELADKHITQTRNILSGSEYWRGRFLQFGLMGLTDDFPECKEDANKALSLLRSKYLNVIK